MYQLTKTSKSIIAENLTLSSEFAYLDSIVDEAAVHIDNEMITKLYDSALNKKHVNFGNIPESKGDITQYDGYQTMLDVLNLVDSISPKGKLEEVEIVRTAIDNIRAFKGQFELGFKLKKEFVILMYNSMVMACVASTSTVISAFVDYVKSPDAIEIRFMPNTKNGDDIILDNLSHFNAAVKKGDINKVLNSINGEKESFVGAASLVIPFAVVGAILAIVPVMRELIFQFYYTRMKLSDYLKDQSDLLEFNKIALQNNMNLTADKKKAILRKQDDAAKKLRQFADKIKVDNATTGKTVRNEIKKENKSLTLNNLQPTPMVKEEDKPYSLENDPDYTEIALL